MVSRSTESFNSERPRELEPGIGLCLSGGGYRAMLFHVGVLWRLYETKMLPRVARVSSVSGGSIVAATLGLKWRSLSFDPLRLREDFLPQVVQPTRALASETIDAEAIVSGIALPGSVSDRIVDAYKAYLFGQHTLQDLPDEPRFVINATNVQSGVLWRFMKPYMRDYRVGEVKSPRVLIAQAVAASSAFPPLLSPFVLPLDPGAFTPGSGTDLQRPPFTSKLVLTDGGVYDNLGLETVWKRYDTVLVSDGGGQIEPQEEPKRDWARHGRRAIEIVENQVGALRKRQVIDAFNGGSRRGAYWGIRTDVRDYGLQDALSCPVERTMSLARTPTRLKRLDDTLQERLVNWGYAVCDAALRRYVDSSLRAPTDFPYPQAQV